MDNFALNVRGRSKESFEHAMAIAFAKAPGGKTSHWCKHSDYGMVLFWNGSEKTFRGEPIVPFPHELALPEAVEICWSWVESIDRSQFNLKDWDRACKMGDVQNEEAWRIFVEDWSHVCGSHYAIAAILPVWAWLGK